MCASMSPRVSSTHSTSDARSDAHSSSARNSSHCARTIVSTASGTRTSRSVRSIVVASKSQTCSRAIFDGVAKNSRISPIVASMRRTRVRRERSADQIGRGLHTLIPHGASDDLRRIGAVAVLVGDVANLLEEIRDIANKYSYRADTTKIIARSVWNQGMETSPDLVR